MLVKKWWPAAFVLLVVILLAFFIRVYQLTILPVFADEAIYIRWAQVMRAEPSLRFLPLSDGKQPLFMWMVIPFLKIFADPLFAGRAVSVLTGLGTLAGIFALSYLLFRSKKAALVAGLIYAISPFGVFFDRMAMADSMLTMFGVWVLFFGLVTAKTLRLDFAMLAGFALGGALLTKSPALFFTLLLPTSWFFSRWPKASKDKLLHLIKLAGLLAVTYAISYGMYNVLRLGPNFNMIGARNQDYVFPISHLWTSPTDPFRPFLDRSVEWIRIMGPSLVILLAALGLFTGFKKSPKAAFLILLWLIFPLLVQSEFAKVFTARYILFSLPYLFILAGLSAEVGGKFVGRLTVLLFGLYIISALKFDYLVLTNPERANLPRSERSGYLEEWTSGYGIKEAADYIRSQYEREPDRKIVVGTEGFFGTLPDGLQIYLNDLPKITVIGVGVTITTLPSSLVESEMAGNKTYFVINNTRFLGRGEPQGLNLVGIYPKAVKPDGSQESLLFFELTKESVPRKAQGQL
jgi:4-amino-4-deoxy-L-arabinose transferase-like glycosyltransferase